MFTDSSVDKVLTSTDGHFIIIIRMIHHNINEIIMLTVTILLMGHLIGCNIKMFHYHINQIIMIARGGWWSAERQHVSV